MLATGIILLFLVPGLAAYSAIYGTFSSGRTIAPEPPSANTIEAVIVIVGASLAIHAASSALFSLNDAVCDLRCPVKVPAGWLDPYGRVFAALDRAQINGNALTAVLAGVAVQGVLTFVACRVWLRYLARIDRLPTWIYGWATPLANSLDNNDTAVIAYILTDVEACGKTVGYGGLIHSIAIRPDGCIARITLVDCERYLVDLASGAGTPSLSDTLSRFSFMVIEAAHIRNVAFETISLAD